MSASPAIFSSVSTNPNEPRARRRQFSQRRIEANRRNAVRSTGPRTPEGKARVARNAIKHGFFAAAERWTPEQYRDFQETREGLRVEMKPLGRIEEYLISEMAFASAKTAMLIRYEGIAAVKFHRRREDELKAQIEAADPVERARLEHRREDLKRAGLWRPTIPGERDARAILRYGGSLERRFYRAVADFERLRDGRHRSVAMLKTQKQTHCEASPSSVLSTRTTSNSTNSIAETLKQSHSSEMDSGLENAKTNPLSPAFPSNRHERRRAQALARKRGGKTEPIR